MKDIEKLEKDMKPKFIEDLGMRYPTETSKWKARFGLYKCQYCGGEFEAQSNSIKQGLKSCGCQKNKQKITHGMSNSRFYKTWRNMTYRCSDPKNKDYKDYGARGITVCEEWQDIRNFVSWAEETYIEGMTMDRINNDGNYEPTNIRWVDKTTQQLNQRIKKNNTSGYVGVVWYKITSKWVAQITVNKIVIRIGYFKDKIEAVQARDNYIIENKLPHKLSGLTKNEKGNK